MGVSMNYLGCRVLAVTRIGWLLAVAASVLLGSGGLTLAAAPPAYTLAEARHDQETAIRINEAAQQV